MRHLLLALVTPAVMLAQSAHPAGKPKKPKARSGSAIQPSATAPRLVATPDFIDLGDVDAMKPVAFAVKLKNQGKDPVELQGVGVSCGCTTPNPLESHHLLPPGTEHIVEVSFNPAGLAGSVSRNLIFQSNDPNRPQFTLTFKANVIASAIPQPEVLVIDGDEGGKPSSQPIRFVPVHTALDPSSVVIEDPKAPLKVTYEKATGGEVRGSLTLDPALLKGDPAELGGQQRTRLILTDKDGGKSAMAVVWAVRPAFWVSPALLVTNTGPGQGFVVYATIVTDRTTKILKTDCSIPGVQVLVGPGDTANTLKLQVRGNGGEKGDMKGTVTLHSDHPVRADLVVPFVVHVL